MKIVPLFMSALTSLASPTAVEQISGSLGFFSTRCPSFTAGLPEWIQIENEEIVVPKCHETAKSLQWSYPSSAFVIQFFENQQSEKPYATITGPESTAFLGFVCEDWKSTGLTVEVDQEIVAGRLGLFLTEESFYKVVRK